MDDKIPANSILRLPNELLYIVLADVASHFQELPDPHVLLFSKGRSSRRRRNQALGFLRLLEVCSRFRALLLSMPFLWARIAFNVPEKPGRLALSRSGSEPLTVSISRSSYWVRDNKVAGAWKRLLRAVVEHAPRIRYISGDDFQLFRRKSKTRPRVVFQKLESIHLSYNLSEMASNEEYVHIPIEAPALENASLSFSPKTTLSFFNGFGRVFALNFPSLQSLEIDLDAHLLPDDPSLEPYWIADVLQESPNLRVLKLTLKHDSNYATNWDTILHDRTIQLPHLQSLELGGRFSANLPDLFEHIASTPPPHCRIEFSELSVSEDMMDLLGYFAGILLRPSCDGLSLLFKGRDEEYGATYVNVFSSPEDTERYRFSSNSGVTESAELELSYFTEYEDTSENDMMNFLLPTFKQNIIRRLHLAYPCPSVQPFLHDLLADACSQVTKLVIDHPWSGNRPGFLLVDLPHALPALHTVCITPSDGTDDKEALCRSWKEFVTWLERRAAMNKRVVRLCIQGHWPMSRDERRDDYNAWNGELCARAASLVDELVDERTEHSLRGIFDYTSGPDTDDEDALEEK